MLGCQPGSEVRSWAAQSVRLVGAHGRRGRNFPLWKLAKQAVCAVLPLIRRGRPNRPLTRENTRGLEAASLPDQLDPYGSNSLARVAALFCRLKWGLGRPAYPTGLTEPAAALGSPPPFTGGAVSVPSSASQPSGRRTPGRAFVSPTALKSTANRGTEVSTQLMLSVKSRGGVHAKTRTCDRRGPIDLALPVGTPAAGTNPAQPSAA